ncbi:MAG: hypothetical protein ACTSYF_00465, partial [Promethearchaeota archaeon]
MIQPLMMNARETFSNFEKFLMIFIRNNPKLNLDTLYSSLPRLRVFFEKGISSLVSKDIIRVEPSKKNLIILNDEKLIERWNGEDWFLSPSFLRTSVEILSRLDEDFFTTLERTYQSSLDFYVLHYYDEALK